MNKKTKIGLICGLCAIAIFVSTFVFAAQKSSAYFTDRSDEYNKTFVWDNTPPSFPYAAQFKWNEEGKSYYDCPSVLNQWESIHSDGTGDKTWDWEDNLDTIVSIYNKSKYEVKYEITYNFSIVLYDSIAFAGEGTCMNDFDCEITKETDFVSGSGKIDFPFKPLEALMEIPYSYEGYDGEDYYLTSNSRYWIFGRDYTDSKLAIMVTATIKPIAYKDYAGNEVECTGDSVKTITIPIYLNGCNEYQRPF